MSKAKKSAKTNRQNKKNKGLLTKYSNVLKKHCNDLSALYKKARKLSGKDQDHFCQHTIEKYRPKITRILTSIERLYPHTRDTEYVEYLRDNFEYSEEGKIDIDVFSDIVISLKGLIGSVESMLEKALIS